MTRAEGIDDKIINLMGDDFINLNNSSFRNMELQWFADDPDPDGGEGEEGDPAEGEPAEPAAPELSGLWSGATAEQREKYGDYFKDIKKLPELIDIHMDLRTKADGVITKPGEGATKEEVAAYNKTLGIPGDASGYEFGELPEGMTKDQDLENWFRNSALTANLNSDQAKNLYGEWNKLVSERLTAISEKRVEDRKIATETLKKEYGKDYDHNMAMAKRVMNLGGKELWDYLEETGNGNDPRLTKVFIEFGRLISEDSLKSLPSRGMPEKKSQAERMYGGKKNKE